LTTTSKTIEVLIKPSGEIVVETKGFAGAACQTASRQLEQALGIARREQLTAEYHLAAAQAQFQQRA